MARHEGMKPVEAETSGDVLAEFCAEHGQRLLRFAYLLTGGRAADAEDLPDEQIAATLGCRQATVRSLIHRAMPKLRRRLDDAYDRPERTADDDI